MDIVIERIQESPWQSLLGLIGGFLDLNEFTSHAVSGVEFHAGA